MKSSTFIPLPEHVKNVTNDEVDILRKDKDFLRSGSFGSVIRGRWGTEIVAIKHFSNRDQYNRNWNEVQQLASCSCDYIVRVLAAGPDISGRKVSFYFMEFADSGSLDYVLHKLEPKIYYNLGQALNWALQAAMATAYLHSHGIIHRDLKPANLLLFENGKKVKLCDFGTTKIANTENTAECGTYVYMAPEVMYCVKENKKAKYDEKCDIYSWTIILWELLMRQKPYAGSHSCFAIVYSVVHLKQHLTDIPKCPSYLKSLIDSGWHFDPRMRPSMSEIVTYLTIITKQISGSFSQLDGLPVHADLSTPSRPSSEVSAPDNPHAQIIESLRQVYLEELNPSCKLVTAISDDEESFSLSQQHLALQTEYVYLQLEVEKLAQEKYDLDNQLTLGAAATPEILTRINNYCQIKTDLEDLKEVSAIQNQFQ